MTTATDLRRKHCRPCKGDVQPLARDEAEQYLSELSGWNIADDSRSIEKKIRCPNGFLEAIEICSAIGPIAEAEDHHPDLHVTAYRWLAIVLSTHAIGGLSENDFILAAKIDDLLAHHKRT